MDCSENEYSENDYMNMQKKKYLWILFAMCVICLICISAGIPNKIRSFVYEWREYLYRNRDLGIEISAKPIEEDNNSWYSRYSVIAHSGGGINDYRYTNSEEAWKHSYENSVRVFDADLHFTSDMRIVLRHGWSENLGQNGAFDDGVPTYDEFMSTLIFGNLTPMSLEMMIDFMAEHEDVYVAVDFKDGVELIRSMVDVFIDSGHQELLDRIIISFYDYNDYDEISSIYSFQNYAIRQYENLPHNYQELAAFCLDNRIPVCMIKMKYLKTDDISILLDNGIKIFVAIINTEEEVKEVQERGGSGIVSDFIYAYSRTGS